MDLEGEHEGDQCRDGDGSHRSERDPIKRREVPQRLGAETQVLAGPSGMQRKSNPEAKSGRNGHRGGRKTDMNAVTKTKGAGV